MSRIALHDLVEQNNSIRNEIDEAIKSVVDANHFLNGKHVAQFEDSFAHYIGVNHCVGVGNATDGFEIVLKALNFKENAEVIIPANAHVSPALAALNSGLRPVFCDVDADRMLLNATSVSAQITDNTKAVIAVHLYGQVCPMDELQKLCRERKLVLIEDFSQAQGATYNGQKVGSFGDASVCSFYPTKPLGAIGDGGAILTSNAKLDQECRTLANYGWNQRDNVSRAGRNSRLDELQAAVLIVKLNHLDKWNSERLEKSEDLQFELNQLDGVSVSKFQDGDVCHLMIIRSERRDELITHFSENGVDCQVHFPVPIHKQELFDSKGELPVAEKLCKEILSVPLNQKVVELVKGFRTT